MSGGCVFSGTNPILGGVRVIVQRFRFFEPCTNVCRLEDHYFPKRTQFGVEW